MVRLHLKSSLGLSSKRSKGRRTREYKAKHHCSSQCHKTSISACARANYIRPGRVHIIQSVSKCLLINQHDGSFHRLCLLSRVTLDGVVPIGKNSATPHFSGEQNWAGSPRNLLLRRLLRRRFTAVYGGCY